MNDNLSTTIMVAAFLALLVVLALALGPYLARVLTVAP